MALTKIPSPTNIPSTVTKVPGTIAGIPTHAGLTRIPDSGAGSPPAVPTLTAPVANGAANLFNGVAVTVAATTSDSPDRIDWVLDPSGAATIVATDSAAPFSQSWTPTGVSDGSHTLIARAVNAFGSTDSAPLTIVVGEVLHTLVTSVTCQRAWQSDFGIATGGTPLASGTGPPPALTLTGAIAGTVAFRSEIQATGTDGVATYRYGALNTGSTSVTWIEQNKVVPAGGGTYAMTGAMAGATLNWPAGTYTNDNVYQGTCSGWVDQKNATTAAQATASKQPLILWDTTTGRFFLRFDGVDDVLSEPTLNLAAPGVANVFVESAFTQRAWTANRGVCSSGTTGGTTQITGQTATPTLKAFNSVAFTAGSAGASLGTLVRCECLWANSAALDYLKLAATSSGTGTATGAGDPPAGWNIGATTTNIANAGAFDVYHQHVFTGAGGPSAGEKTALDTAQSSMYPGIGV